MEVLEGQWDSRGREGVQGVGLTNEEAMQEAGLSVVDFVNVRMALWRCWKGSGTAEEARGCRVWG